MRPPEWHMESVRLGADYRGLEPAAPDFEREKENVEALVEAESAKAKVGARQTSVVYRRFAAAQIRKNNTLGSP